MLHLRGKFIVFDGNEGCGKSNAALLLVAAMEKSGVEVLAVPRSGSYAWIWGDGSGDSP